MQNISNQQSIDVNVPVPPAGFSTTVTVEVSHQGVFVPERPGGRPAPRPFRGKNVKPLGSKKR